MEKPKFSDECSLGSLLRFGESELGATSPTPRLDSELLLSHVTAAPRWKMLADSGTPVAEEQARRFKEILVRRRNQEPVAYIVGSREFWSLEFEVTPDVLIPRPESELLVSEGAQILRAQSGDLSFADLGTGSGCLAVSLLTELQDRTVRCAAVDISRAALSIAKRNAERHGLQGRVEFLEGSWFEPLIGREKTFDLIVSNPPYVSQSEPVSPETRFEPQGALFSGDNGLADTRAIVAAAPRFLKPGGALLCEVGAGKRPKLEMWRTELEAAWNVRILGDEGAGDRFAVLELTLKERSSSKG